MKHILVHKKRIISPVSPFTSAMTPFLKAENGTSGRSTSGIPPIIAPTATIGSVSRLIIAAGP